MNEYELIQYRLWRMLKERLTTREFEMLCLCSWVVRKCRTEGYR